MKLFSLITVLVFSSFVAINAQTIPIFPTQPVKSTNNKQSLDKHEADYVGGDALKILYIGLENPISVLGATNNGKAIKVTIDNGTLIPYGAGKYGVNVKKGTESNITVKDNGTTSIYKFRVKQIPNPIAKIGGLSGGSFDLSEFKSQQGVRAELENFTFEGVRFTIQSYNVIGVGNGFKDYMLKAQNTGAEFESDARSIIDRCMKGSVIIIDDIKVVGPDDQTRLLPPIVFMLY